MSVGFNLLTNLSFSDQDSKMPIHSLINRLLSPLISLFSTPPTKFDQFEFLTCTIIADTLVHKENIPIIMNVNLIRQPNLMKLTDPTAG